MSEQDLYGEILRAHSRGATRLFRLNSGTIAWQGTITHRTDQTLTLLHPRAIKLAPPGVSDLAGWSPLQILQSDVGRTVALFTAIEGKSARGRADERQSAFIALVKRCGGRAGVARSVAEAAAIITDSG